MLKKATILNVLWYIKQYMGLLLKNSKLFKFPHMVSLINSADPDEMTHFVESHLDLHC